MIEYHVVKSTQKNELSQGARENDLLPAGISNTTNGSSQQKERGQKAVTLHTRARYYISKVRVSVSMSHRLEIVGTIAPTENVKTSVIIIPQTTNETAIYKALMFC